MGKLDLLLLVDTSGKTDGGVVDAARKREGVRRMCECVMVSGL